MSNTVGRMTEHRVQITSVLWIFAGLACAGAEAPHELSDPAAAAPVQPASVGQAPEAVLESTSAATKQPGPASTPTQVAESTKPPPAQGTAPAATAGSSAPVVKPAPEQGLPDVPCAVKKAVTKNCQSCHGTTPIGGAPMPLMTAEDFQAPAVTQPNLKVHELSLQRMRDEARPMPPGAAIEEADKRTIMDWLSAGAVAEATVTACDTGSEMAAATAPKTAGAHGLTPRPGETCYDFQSHNGMTADDKTPFEVAAGEHYEQFYFKIPWPAGSVATRFGSKLDNVPVLHHWLLFSSARSESLHGTHEPSIGSQLGDSGAQMVAGWALGGDDIEFPSDVGLLLPTSGLLNFSWHYYNQADSSQKDASAAQVCVVDQSMRENIASWSSLGTEDLGGTVGMPARQRNEYSGTCRNRSSGPITLWGFLPHMHQLGRHMKTVVSRVDGKQEVVFDKPFDFNSQIHYPLDPMIVLQPGDSITSTCSFENTTNAPVPYGSSSDQEMCYQFTFAYPAGALDNQAFSLTGISNACWGD